MVVGDGEKNGGKDREFGIDRYTLLYLKWITNKVLLYSTGNSAQCYVAAWIRGEFVGEWIHVYVWLSPFAVHLKLLQHCEPVTLQYKIKSFLKKRIEVLYRCVSVHSRIN